MNDASAVAAIRRFNRFYTRQIGALGEGHLDSRFSLTEARVLYELAHGAAPTASGLARELRLDGGYLSRILADFERRGLLTRQRSEADGRQNLLHLTASGRSACEELAGRAGARMRELLAPLDGAGRRDLLQAMQVVERLLGGAAGESAPYLLRPHRAGDMGWVVHRQAVLYAQEYGWNYEYEALIARIVANFLERFDSARERCWIAERDGAIVGSVFVVRHPERAGVARLRLLYVEPAARGLGIGSRLVRECTEFARLAGYHTLTLWTNDVLTSARRIYEAEGYHLIREEAHGMFGHQLVGQTWELAL